MSNAFMERIAAEKDAAMQISERITRQFDMDTLQCALARYGKLELGYKRIMEITELWEKTRREYEDAIAGGVEADVAREHLDRELLQIAKDPALIIPFAKRYPELRQETYEGKRRRK